MQVERLFVASSDAAALATSIARLQPRDDEMVGIFVAEKNRPDLDALIAHLDREGMTFFGGLFPAIIEGHEKRDSGVLAVKLPRLGEPLLVTGLDRPDFPLPHGLSDLVSHAPFPRSPTAFVLVDGLAPNTSRLLEAVYHQLGNRVHYWGGGAGSLALERTRCLFTRQGAFANAAIIALSTVSCGLGVRHGWRALKGPLVVTRARSNVIEQLNWRNPLEVYRSVVERDLGKSITPENFFVVTSNYPLGIEKTGQEFVVRDPVSVGADGSLTCVGDVPENAVVRVLKGTADDLIAAAGEAADEACGSPDDGEASGRRRAGRCLIADCVSRAIFLGDRLTDELALLERRVRTRSGDSDVIGLFTLGEISSQGESYLELFNKTTVVALLHEP